MYLSNSGTDSTNHGARRWLHPEGTASSRASGGPSKASAPHSEKDIVHAGRLPAESPIFVAESDPGGKGALNRILREFQLKNVTFADDYYKALHKGRFDPYTLLLVSQTVGKGEGLKLLANLRQQGMNTKAPIIFFLQTAGDEAIRQQAEKAGATGVIAKPLEEDPFRELLERVLGKSILTRKAQSARDNGYNTATGELVERGRSLLANGDLKGAETAFENALVTGAGSDEVYCGLAEVYLSRGDREAAEKVLVEAQRIDPLIRDKFRLREKSFLRRAEQFFESKNRDQARNELEGALYANPKSLSALAGMGEFLNSIGEPDEAKSAFERALALESRPEDLHAYNRIGIAARKNANYGQALSAFNKALAYDPEDHVLHYNKAVVYIAQREFREALACLQESLNLNPDFIYALNAQRNIQDVLNNASSAGK